MPAIRKYGTLWPEGSSYLQIELAAIRKGGKWKNVTTGEICGEGLYHHYVEASKLLWSPGQCEWHRFARLLLKSFVENEVIGVMGPASSGKTFTAAVFALITYWAHPEECTIVCSTTTQQMLDYRIWGEIKRLYSEAKKKHPLLYGHHIDSRHTIITDKNIKAGRDFRNGIVGLACRSGDKWRGLGAYVGIKNKIIVYIGDEMQFMAQGFLDSLANFRKGASKWCRMIGMGNPSDIQDPLGKICEPRKENGGWDAVDPSEKTKTWPTEIPGGICVQLVGTDSPNYEYPEDQEPYAYLIKRKQIEQDKQYYGADSTQYQQMNLGMMPRSGSARRVITKDLCYEHHACEAPIWDGKTKLTKVAGLDAAGRGVGGDRTVFCELNFGLNENGRLILAHVDTVIIPVRGGRNDADDQIVLWTKMECEKRGIDPSHVGFDASFRGGLMSAFARLWDKNVQPIDFLGKATDRPIRDNNPRTCWDEYGKFVTELWFMVKEVVVNDQFRGMTQDLMEEGCWREWVTNKDGKIDVETKDKTKLRMGRSPDKFDALVCGVEIARRVGFRLSKGSAQLNAIVPWLKNLKKQHLAMQVRSQLVYN